MIKHTLTTVKVGRRYHVYCASCLMPMVPDENWRERLDMILSISQMSRADFALASGISYASLDKLYSGNRSFAWLVRVSSLDCTDLLENDQCQQLTLPLEQLDAAKAE